MHQPIDDTPISRTERICVSPFHDATRREAEGGQVPFFARGCTHNVQYTDSHPIQLHSYPALIFPKSFLNNSPWNNR